MNATKPLTKANWKGTKILILGLGQYPQGSGVSAALTFARAGADVTVTDLKTAADLGTNVRRLRRFSNVRFVLGRHDLNDVKVTDLIVANPRVRRIHPRCGLYAKQERRLRPISQFFWITVRLRPLPLQERGEEHDELADRRHAEGERGPCLVGWKHPCFAADIPLARSTV